MSLIHVLADWAAGLTRADVPESAIHAARRLLIDRLGISLGGHRLLGPHPASHLAAGLPGVPSATVWGTRSAAFAPYAALANGCAGDGLELAAGPDCVEAGAVAGETADRLLGDLLVAVVAGAEIGGYVRRWLAEPLERHGLHPPGALGGFSAAVTAGRLLGLAPDQLAGALGSVGCLAPQAPFGAFTAGASGKTLYGGWPHLLGVWACLWARDGMSGSAAALEGPRGVAQAVLDDGGTVTPPAFEPAAGSWEVERVTFKPFPACRSSHPALTVLAKLGPIDPDSVESVRVWTYPYAVELECRARGDSPITAQASVRKTVALWLHLGALEPGRAFSTSNLADPRLMRLADRISVELGTDYAGPGPRRRGARVQVALRDGRLLDEAVDEPRWGLTQPATDRELVSRFEQLAPDRLRTLGSDLLGRSEDTPVRTLMAEMTDRG